MRLLQNAPLELPPEIEKPLCALAKSWMESSLRPRIDLPAIEYWDELVDLWLADVSLPLYIRKWGREVLRGSMVNHKTKRVLIPTDNSPAHWSFMSAFMGRRLTIAEVKAEITADEIPIAMALTKIERQSARFRCCRGAIGNPNDFGWKLCHINPVALKVRGPLPDVPIENIHRHFKDFVSPSNMFLIPKSISGLGEVPHFTEAMAHFRDRP